MPLAVRAVQKRHVRVRASCGSAAVGCFIRLAAALILLAAISACQRKARNVRYEPSAPEVVDALVRLAKIGPGDVVYDLGCGDGRVVIAAVARGARGICVELDPVLITVSRAHAITAGVADRIRFVREDLRTTDVSDATVVMLYLSQALNVEIRPRLLRMLRPGSRIVSHWHDMGDWPPEKTIRVMADGWSRPLYRWTVK